LNARVLVIGAGGLGSPVIQYLAAAGVGTIGVVDDDVVDLSNLQRQILHNTQSVGTAKVDSAARTVAGLNPDVKIIPIRERLNKDNAAAIIADYPIVADGSDNFTTRFLVNDACRFAGAALVSAAILRFDGQLSTFKPDGPCYRCIYAEEPPEGTIPSCSSAGILGAVAGIMGSLQAVEVLKEILGIGESMSGKLMIYDALSQSFRNIRVKRDPGCPLCGDHPTITDLSGHGSTEHACG
jgi:molybdopterin-synthase adenylyltransferase